MTTTHPDHDTVRRAIALATRAPSVHNTQPWQWLLGDQTMHLMADWDRHLPATDPDGRDLLVSCGAMLHHTLTALAALGWAADVHLLPNPGEPAHLASLELHPRQPTEADIALSAAITRRRTDRRRFSSWEVPASHLDLICQRASRAGALLVPVTDPDTRHQLATAIAQATVQQQSDTGYTDELTLWSGRSPAATDGVLAASAPTHPTTHGDTRMRTYRHGTLPESTQDHQDDDGGELLVLATPTDDTKSRLHAGEATSATLLTATDLNLASCPLSQPLEIPKLRAVIQERVLDGYAFPQLVLRVGWAPTSARPLPQSPRRPVEEIVHYLPGMTPRHHGW